MLSNTRCFRWGARKSSTRTLTRTNFDNLVDPLQIGNFANSQMVKANYPVAVIGAGPSGLATAKYLLEAGLQPTIFEARSHVGGLWAPREDGIDTAQLHPDMRANASKYTCTFSDFFPSAGKELPMFPTAAQVGRYLQQYAERFIPQERIRLGTRVTNVTGGRNSSPWVIESFRINAGTTTIESFPYLVVATGVWSVPYLPPIPGLASFKGKIIHSSQYADQEIIAGHSGNKNRKIVVVGGTLSAAEVAADIALRASSLPEDERSLVEIFHVFPQPPWVFPKVLAFNNPQDRLAPRVLPLDLFFQNVEGVPKINACYSPEDVYNFDSAIIPPILGGDQEKIHPALKVTEHWLKKAPTIAMSDSYAQFVRTGTIQPHLGRLSEVRGDNTLRVSPIHGDSKPLDLTNVDTICLATGYSPWRALERIFDPEMLQAFGKPNNVEIPENDMLLKKLWKQTLHPAFENTGGFIGMMKRAFFGTMELQARLLTDLIAGKIQWPTQEDFTDVIKGTSWLMERGKTREAIIQSSGGDYLDFLNQIGKDLGIEVLQLANNIPTSPKTFIPAHIPRTSNGDISDDARNTLVAFENDISYKTTTSPRSISPVIFANLQGRWKISRKLDSQLSGFPSGTFTGWAEFQPRLPTFGYTTPERVPVSPKPIVHSLGRSVTEYLYVEEGELLTETGLKLTSKRKYIYQLDEETSDITTWFVKPDGDSVDYFFHVLDFNQIPEELGTPGVDDKGGWKAAASHLCEKDLYLPGYRFTFRAAFMDKFWIRYKVNGPQKDYISEAEYYRE